MKICIRWKWNNSRTSQMVFPAFNLVLSTSPIIAVLAWLNPFEHLGREGWEWGIWYNLDLKWFLIQFYNSKFHFTFSAFFRFQILRILNSASGPHIPGKIFGAEVFLKNFEFFIWMHFKFYVHAFFTHFDYHRWFKV